MITRANLFYDTLKSKPAFKLTQRDRVFIALYESKEKGLPLNKLLKLHIAQYNARIFELRELFKIDCKEVWAKNWLGKSVKHTCYFIEE
jgi:hypothetical protein